MKYEELKAKIELSECENILEAIEENNKISCVKNDYEKEALELFHGSKLKDKVNAIYLSSNYECIEYSEYMGVIYCYLDIETFLNTDSETLDCLDECFWFMFSGFCPILDTDIYNQYKWDMINDVLYNTDLNLSESEFTLAAEYLSERCFFYSDFIDYDESELKEYIGARRGRCYSY